jgi:hypothetical protein
MSPAFEGVIFNETLRERNVTVGARVTDGMNLASGIKN